MGKVQTLRANAKLDSRIRFMLQDLIDLRGNRWEARRKAEGPKRIEDIHKEAREQAARTALNDMRGRLGPSPAASPRTQGATPRGSTGFGRNPSFNSPRVLSKSDGPGGESLRPMGGRPAPPPPPAPAAKAPAPAAAAPAAAAAAPARAAPAAPMSSEEARTKSRGLVNEFVGAHDIKEAATSLKELQDAGADMGLVLREVVVSLLNTRGGLELWAMLAPVLLQSAKEGVFGTQLLPGLTAVMAAMVFDVEAPVAPTLVGRLAGDMCAAGMLPLNDLAGRCESVAPEGEEAGVFIEEEKAAGFMGGALAQLAAAQGEEEAKKALAATGKTLVDFLPSFLRDDAKELQKLADKHQLAFLL